jgi:putative ABC transport system substrate-binding protein
MMLRTIGLISTLALGLLAGPLTAEAQQAGKVYRIGFLAFGPPPSGLSPSLEAFRQRLQELGYVEGQNLILEPRYAKGNIGRLPGLASELIRLKMDIIVTSGTSAAWAAKEATKTIPIVIAGASDPVAFGLVANLARPGGNVTGFSDLPGRQIEGKRLELLKEIVPTISRVAVVLDSTSRRDPTPLDEAAKALGFTLLLSDEEVEAPDEFQSAFATMIRERADALYAPETPVNVIHRSLIIELAAKNQIPAMYGSREFVEAGGLMSYGPSFADLFRRTAGYVDKILKGTKPANLPVQQPTRFELVINLKTAKKIGLRIPPEMLIRADKVIK